MGGGGVKASRTYQDVEKVHPWFFNYDLDEVNSSRSHKLLDFSSLAIWQSIHGLPSRVFFNTLLSGRGFSLTGWEASQ